ncbi:Uncharacterised protein r2_g3794 [Pycnogonum litorale]
MDVPQSCHTLPNGSFTKSKIQICFCIFNYIIPLIILTFIGSALLCLYLVMSSKITSTTNVVLLTCLTAFVLAMFLGNWILLFICKIPKKHIADDLRFQFNEPLNTSRENSELSNCRYCDELKPVDTHHCPLCEKCIPFRDHHCFFFGTCISLSNMKHFVLSLFYTTICCVILLVLILPSMERKYPELFGAKWYWCFMPISIAEYCMNNMDIIQLNFVFCLNSSVMFTLITSLFFFYQMHQIINGRLSYYHKKVPTSKNCFKKNIMTVFGAHYFLIILFPCVYQCKL